MTTTTYTPADAGSQPVPSAPPTTTPASAKDPNDVLTLRKYFGLQSGQSLPQFKTEVTKLSREERAELAAMVRALETETA